jgi:sugar phosphate isomerase/epimerase
VTLGFGHGADYWANFTSTLKSVGYDDVLSIEHEDVLMEPELAVERSVNLLKNVIF